MEALSTVVYLVICALLVLLLIKIFTTPIRWALKLLLNMLSGIVMLFVFNLIGGLFDFTLGINAINALVAGILGIPGVILLVLLKLFL